MVQFGFHLPAVAIPGLAITLLTSFSRYRIPKVPHWVSSPGIAVGIGLLIVSSIHGLPIITSVSLIAVLVLIALAIEWCLNMPTEKPAIGLPLQTIIPKIPGSPKWDKAEPTNTAENHSAETRRSESFTQEVNPVRDTYSNNGTNNGFIGRNEGTINFDKPAFAMTEAIMADVLSRIDRSKPVTLYSIGSSWNATKVLETYLCKNGVQVAATNRVGSWSVGGIDIPDAPVRVGEPAPRAFRDPNSTPITVDVSK